MLRKSLVVFAFLFLAAVVVMAAEPAGKPLPAGGGEPGKAYVAYCKAIEAGDMAALKKLVAADKAKQMESEDFKKMFPMIQAMQAKDIKITGGTMTETEATLNAEGTDRMDGAPSKGTISMVLEEKQWKVNKDAWKSSAATK